MIVSQFNTQITLDFLQNQRENQYFERKGLGEKEVNPTKIANDGTIQNLSSLGEKLSEYRNVYVDFIEPHGNIKLEEVEIEGKLIFPYSSSFATRTH